MDKVVPCWLMSLICGFIALLAGGFLGSVVVRSIIKIMNDNETTAIAPALFYYTPHIMVAFGLFFGICVFSLVRDMWRRDMEISRKSEEN